MRKKKKLTALQNLPKRVICANCGTEQRCSKRKVILKREESSQYSPSIDTTGNPIPADVIRYSEHYILQCKGCGEYLRVSKDIVR